MSEETTAFDGEVHRNGGQLGVASNTGRGSPNTYSPISAEGAHAFRAAKQSFPGIPDKSYGGTLGLIDALVETAAVAKQFGGGRPSLVPDMEVGDFITNTEDVQAYKVTPRPGETSTDVAHDVIHKVPEVETLLYPVREKKGHWLHMATR